MTNQGHLGNTDCTAIERREAGISIWQWIGKHGLFPMCVLVALIAATFVQPQLHAQATSGTILGLVQDQTGAVIPDATVTITNVGTGESKVAKTDVSGNYAVLYLIPGSYQVRAEKQGFSAAAHGAFG